MLQPKGEADAVGTRTDLCVLRCYVMSLVLRNLIIIKFKDPTLTDSSFIYTSKYKLPPCWLYYHGVKCEITLYEPEEKKSFGKLSSRLKDIIKMFMKELNRDVYWFHFPQHRDRLKAFVFTIMNLRFPHSTWNFLINWGNVRLSRWTQLCGINAL
jgi:hypothetical protein